MLPKIASVHLSLSVLISLLFDKYSGEMERSVRTKPQRFIEIYVIVLNKHCLTLPHKVMTVGTLS